MSQCKAGCGFFGTDANEGYCSVCYTKSQAGEAINSGWIITVKTLTGKQLVMAVQPSTTMEELANMVQVLWFLSNKFQVEEREGIPADQQTYFANGRLLLAGPAMPEQRIYQLSNTLEEGGVTNGGSVSLILGLRGD